MKSGSEQTGINSNALCDVYPKEICELRIRSIDQLEMWVEENQIIIERKNV
jgi:hypothetical protein